MVNFKDIYHFRGGPIFSRGGVQLFTGGGGGGWGVQLLIPYRSSYNLTFSRGVRTPCPPPLDPHLPYEPSNQDFHCLLI